mmetsp:Transcript_13601/g.22760  ORF Transcript_13601/g.22760 Transcript_13601/m.22760 type:complete len:108 (-) Transcript_13601:506-829(-)
MYVWRSLRILRQHSCIQRSFSSSRIRGDDDSSTRWLKRQSKDVYVAQRESLNYRSRSAFKLLQIDNAHHILRPGMTVIDLGCGSGGWTQVALERMKAQGRVISVDIE